MTKSSYAIFIGTKRQVTNQWVQFFLLALGSIVLVISAWDVANLSKDGWWLVLRAAAKTSLFAASWWLIRGRLGDILNGPRLPGQRAALQPEFDPLQLHYYPSGGNLPLERGPKRQPMRQREEDN